MGDRRLYLRVYRRPFGRRKPVLFAGITWIATTALATIYMPSNSMPHFIVGFLFGFGTESMIRGTTDLLGHATFATMEKHYIMPDAHWAQKIDGLKREWPAR